MSQYIIVKPDELYHHGVKGQKHGVRNGPPYPLSAGQHSASEKKAGWQKSLDKGSSPTKKKATTKKVDVVKGVRVVGGGIKKAGSSVGKTVKSAGKAISQMPQKRQQKQMAKLAKEKAKLDLQKQKLDLKRQRRQLKEEAKNSKEKQKVSERLEKKELMKNNKPSQNKQDVRKITNDELQERVNRLRLEQTYSQLVAESNPKKSSGADYVKKLAGTTAKRAVESVAPQVATYFLKQGVKKGLNLTDEQYKEMFPKKK